MHEDPCIKNVECDCIELEHESTDIGTPDEDWHRAADADHVKVILMDTSTCTIAMNVGFDEVITDASLMTRPCNMRGRGCGYLALETCADGGMTTVIYRWLGMHYSDFGLPFDGSTLKLITRSNEINDEVSPGMFSTIDHLKDGTDWYACPGEFSTNLENCGIKGVRRHCSMAVFGEL